MPVTLSWEGSEVTVDEDDGSATLRAFAVTTVDKRPEEGFSFDASIYTSNGTASQPDDYTQVDETITFDRSDFSRATVNGQPRYRAVKNVMVDIEDDTADEIEEDFTVTFEYANPGALHLQGGSAIATVKIADNDFVPITLSWYQAEASVSEDAGSITLFAQAITTEGGAPLSDVSFDVRAFTSSGSAKSNNDFTSLSETQTFLHTDFSVTSVNGDLRYRAEKQITVDIQNDAYDEGDESFTLRLEYASTGLPYLTGGSATATVTITNDDEGGPPPPPVTPGTPSTPAISAASASSVRVAWSAPSGGPSPASYELRYRRDGAGS